MMGANIKDIDPLITLESNEILTNHLEGKDLYELAGGIKYNQEERAGAGHAFSPLHDYLKWAEGAHADEIAKLTLCKYKII